MEIFRSETKAGLLIVISGILLAMAIFIVGDLRTLWEGKKTIVLLFKNADGISIGSPVWYAGFEVGEVSELGIIHGTIDRIALTVRIDPEARVREDSKAYIRNLGMMGAKYVEISPGSRGAPELADGDVLEGETPTSLAQMLETGENVARDLQETIRDVQVLIRNFQGEASVRAVIENANTFLVDMQHRGKDVERILQKAEALLSSAEGSIQSVASSIEGTSQSVNEVAKDGGEELIALLGELRRTNQELQNRIANLEQQLTPVFAQANTDLKEAEGLIRDVRDVVEANDQNLYLLVFHLKEASRYLDSLSEDLRANPWKIVWKSKGSSDERGGFGPEAWQSGVGSGSFDEE